MAGDYGKRRLARAVLHACLVAVGLTRPIAGQGDELDARHGSVTRVEAPLDLSGGLTLTYQYPDDRGVDDEALASADLVLTLGLGPGGLTIYLEASTTPRSGGVADRLGEANADAGTALDADGHGRVQISELHYDLPAGPGLLTVGLIDPTGFLDPSEIANNETRQFLSAGLVNNPSVEFPDYTLGLVYHRHQPGGSGWPGYTLMLAGTHGLAENRGAYGELVDLRERRKGVFAALEAYRRHANATWRLGLWANTASHTALDGDTGDLDNYGVYGVLDWRWGASRWNLRAGLARERVSEVARFASVALERPIAGTTTGLGLAYSGASNDLGPGHGGTVQAELYARFELTDSLQLTPSIQWLRNSGLDDSGTVFDTDLLLLGLRLEYAL